MELIRAKPLPLFLSLDSFKLSNLTIKIDKFHFNGRYSDRWYCMDSKMGQFWIEKFVHWSMKVYCQKITKLFYNTNHNQSCRNLGRLHGFTQFKILDSVCKICHHFFLKSGEIPGRPRARPSIRLTYIIFNKVLLCFKKFMGFKNLHFEIRIKSNWRMIIINFKGDWIFRKQILIDV